MIENLNELNDVIEEKVMEKVRGFLEYYILDLYKNLRDSIYYNTGKTDGIQIKINTAIEIASNFGIVISKDEDVVVLPNITIDWD